ncbi:uncharacterized protein V6R79_015322 [Siganus canaliculatus]
MLSVAATCLGDTANDPSEKQRQRVAGRKRGRLKHFYLSAEHPVFDTACKTDTYRTLTGQMDPGSVSSADNEVEGQRAASLDGTSASEGKPSRLRLTCDRVFPACPQPAAAFLYQRVSGHRLDQNPRLHDAPKYSSVILRKRFHSRGHVETDFALVKEFNQQKQYTFKKKNKKKKKEKKSEVGAKECGISSTT